MAWVAAAVSVTVALAVTAQPRGTEPGGLQGARLMVQSGQLGGGGGAGKGFEADALALSPNAQLLASADADAVRIWHTPSGRLLCELDLAAVSTARREASAAITPSSAEARAAAARSGDGEDAAPDLAELLAEPMSLAWSADAQTLYGSAPGLPLQRWSVAQCRQVGALALPFPQLRPSGRADLANREADFYPREMVTLADGTLLAHSPAGLYRLRVQGERLQAEVLADQTRIRRASGGAAREAEAAEAAARPGGAASAAPVTTPDGRTNWAAAGAQLRGALGKLAREAQLAAVDVIRPSLIAASADGRTALLGQPVLASGIAGLLAMGGGPNLSLPSIQPLVVVDGQPLTLAAFAGARPSYPGATLAAASPSGRWLALRSDAAGGARLSLFDLKARRLVQETVLATSDEPPDGEAERAASLFRRMWAGTGAAQALAGLAFSPDETQLLLFRHRVEPVPGGRDTGTGPVLELRRLDALATVARRLPLQGSVLPPADLATQVRPVRGNVLVAAANAQSFAFQVTRLAGAPTMVAAVWQNGLPALRQWSPGEGSVDQLEFSDDDHLLSVHRAPLAPGDQLQPFLHRAGRTPGAPASGPAGEAEAPGFLARIAEAANAMQNWLQVVSWSLDTGVVQSLHRGRTLHPGGGGLVKVSTGLATPVDPQRRRQFVLSSRAEAGGNDTAELAMQPFDEQQPGWQQPLRDAQGRNFSLERSALSPDGRWLALVFGARDKAAVRIGDGGDAPAAAPAPARPAAPPPETSSLPGGLGRSLADRLRPDVAEKLRDTLRALRGAPPRESASAPAAPPAASVAAPAVPATAAPAVPATAAPAAPAGTDNWFPSSGSPLLLLVDAATGKALAAIAIGEAELRSPVLQFVTGQRIVVGQRLVEIRGGNGSEGGGALRLASPYGRAYDGRWLGVSAQTGRPIVIGGSSAGSLRALQVPDAWRDATLATTDAEDRWLAVAQRDQVVVLDARHDMRPVVTLGLDGARVNALRFSPGGRLLAVGLSSGLIKLVDAPAARVLATLLSSADGHWTVVDPQGRLDSSNLGGNAALHWVTADNPLKPLPFDALMRAYHTPDLLARAVRGDAALATLPSMAGRLRATPQVTIDAVEPMPGAADRVRLRVSVSAPREADGSAGGAFDLRVLRNGRLVAFAPAADGALPLDAASGRFSAVFDDIRLPAGDEPLHFQAYAFNRDGVRGDTATATWRPPTAVRLPQGRAYVLAVGTNRYDVPEFAELGFAVNDARLLSQAVGDGLRRSGAWREVVTVTLESAPGGRNDATKARIEAALAVLAGRPQAVSRLSGVPGAEKLAAATPADLVVLAFAGHGYVSPATRELQLVPSDVRAAAGAEGLARFDASTVSALELDRWLRPMDAGHLAIVIDACHSAAAVAAGFRGGPTGSRGLGQLASDKGARLLAATQAADQAMEHQRLQHGLLTYVLVKEGLIAGRADLRPTDGRVDLLEWLRYAEDRLPKLHVELGRGSALAPVQGERAVGRGIVRPGVGSAATGGDAGQAALRSAQRPRLFDFVPPGHAEPVVGLVAP